MHHAHATAVQFLKDAVVRNRNPEERVRSCHRSPSRHWGQIVTYDLRRIKYATWHRNARSSDLVRRYQHRSAFLFNQENEEFRRFGFARVPPDDVNIRGTFIECLPRCERHFLSSPHLHHD